jgi:single-strand DNA-binding protein
MSQGLNKTSIIGFLGKDPLTNDQGTVARFSVGVTERWKDAEGNDKDHTEWFQVVCFHGVAAACSQFLSRGRQVYVEGRLRTRTYTDRNEEERTTTELLAQAVIFLGSPRAGDDRDQQQPNPGKPEATAQAPARSSRAADRSQARNVDNGGDRASVPF